MLSAWWRSDSKSSIELNGALEAQHEAMDDNLVYQYCLLSLRENVAKSRTRNYCRLNKRRRSPQNPPQHIHHNCRTSQALFRHAENAMRTRLHCSRHPSATMNLAFCCPSRSALIGTHLPRTGDDLPAQANRTTAGQYYHCDMLRALTCC